MSFLFHDEFVFLGSLLLVAGYAGTLWCYAALGDAWRLGIRRRERTVLVRTGPYRLVRHPIYLFQCVMLLGAAVLLPTPFSLLMVGVQALLVFIKAMDEEAYLMEVHGSEYADYLRRTGRFFPIL
jgi:protein-S-isoprenylcysteine O-methyltransferase Ste14